MGKKILKMELKAIDIVLGKGKIQPVGKSVPWTLNNFLTLGHLPGNKFCGN